MLDKYLKIAKGSGSVQDIPKTVKNPLTVLGWSPEYSKQDLIKRISRHANFSPGLLQTIKKIPEIIFLNNGTQEAKKILKMVKEIGLEAYRAIQFTRTKLNNRGIIYGKVLLKHKVEDEVLVYFHERWPMCIVCLFNEYRKQTYTIDEDGKLRKFKKPLSVVVEKLGLERPIQPYFEDIKVENEEMFEALYSSQFIKSRDNRKYFRKMIPKKCMELPGMKGGIEKRFQNAQIDLNSIVKTKKTTN